LIEDVPNGAHFILVGSDGLVRTFQKIDVRRGKFVSGSDSVYLPSGPAALSWEAFPAYAISGSGTGNQTEIELKEDLVFIGGDGSPQRPYYAEPAGYGGSASPNSNLLQQLVNATIFSAETNNALLQDQLHLQQAAIRP